MYVWTPSAQASAPAFTKENFYTTVKGEYDTLVATLPDGDVNFVDSTIAETQIDPACSLPPINMNSVVFIAENMYSNEADNLAYAISFHNWALA